jgi:hypothetical protein
MRVRGALLDESSSWAWKAACKTTGMRKHAFIGSLAFHAGALLLGFLLGTAAHQVRHKSPAVIRFEPALHKLPHGTKSTFTRPDRVV